ncbi:aconitate hydratase [bacterium]|nr:aconitate hydratase [bacterium]
MNVTEKILSEHFVSGEKTPGAPVAIKIDQTLTQDATGTMAYLEFEALGKEKVETELSVSYIDHNTAQMGPNNMNDHLYLRSVTGRFGIKCSLPGNGICHQVHLERFGKPGKTLLGSDSHTPTGGGLGMLAMGAGGLDVALAMAGKPFTIKWPKVIGVKLTGSLPEWVAAKDVILKLLSILTTKGNVGCVVEYFGPGVASLSVPQRATITNMGAELGVTTSLFPSDDRTKEFLEAQGRGKDFKELLPDMNASYDRVIEIDLSTLEPLAAMSPSPDNIKKISEVEGTKVHQVIIGSCTNSSYRDLTLAAALLRGRRVHPDVSFLVAPGSRQVLQMIDRDGSLSTFITAGARSLESACGPCIGQGLSPAEGTVSVRTFNRNFSGRTGTPNDTVFLTSPETAVMAAICGEIVDPRKQDVIKYPKVEEPERYDVDDWLIVPPPRRKPEIFRASTIGRPPENEPLPENIKGEILIKLGDKITTDHIMPAGAFLKFRSNIPKYAEFVFNCFSEEGKPTFAQRALKAKAEGRHGVILAGLSYGQGSSREHAAICPMYLGVKVVMALSFERIHTANLINFGILPLVIGSPEDKEKLEKAESLEIKGLPEQLKKSSAIEVLTDKGEKITLSHALTEREVEIVLAGGIMNLFKKTEQ